MCINPKVSVIVPVYNVEKYLKECLDSLLGQTYTNIEIIAVNDGSTDTSGDILKTYAHRKSQINVFEKSNGGLSSARNFGLDNVTGEFVLFVDSDDVLHYQTIEIMVKTIQRKQADIVICGLKKYYANETIKLDAPLPQKDCVSLSVKGAYQLLFDETFPAKLCRGGYACSKLYRKELLASFRFDETRLVYEDEDFSARLLKSAPQPFNVCYVDIPVYYYRQRKGSLVNSKRTKRLFALYACRRALLRHFKRTDEVYDVIDQARLNVFIKLMQNSLAQGYRGGYSLFRKILFSRGCAINTMLPYLFGASVASIYCRYRLTKAERKNQSLSLAE